MFWVQGDGDKQWCRSCNIKQQVFVVFKWNCLQTDFMITYPSYLIGFYIFDTSTQEPTQPVHVVKFGQSGDEGWGYLQTSWSSDFQGKGFTPFYVIFSEFWNGLFACSGCKLYVSGMVEMYTVCSILMLTCVIILHTIVHTASYVHFVYILQDKFSSFKIKDIFCYHVN